VEKVLQLSTLPPLFSNLLPTSRPGAQQKHHRKCSAASSKLCLSVPIASMAARPLHGLQSVEQFAEFQKNLRLPVIPTGEAHQETSARLLTNQFRCQPRVCDWHQLHHEASSGHARVSQLYSRIRRA
jgi:hypothetical protein